MTTSDTQRKLKILIANDEPSILLIIEAMLKKLCIDPQCIDQATDGNQAIEKGTEEQFDIIIMDLEMP